MATDTLKRKRIILFRHTKSAWPEGVEDHDRPLADRGKKAAPVMGFYLVHNMLVPDLVVVSTARRAQETWIRASKALKTTVAVEHSREIYEASPDALFGVIRAVDPEVRTLMLVGHNPGLEMLARRLMTDAGGDMGARLREKFPTGAIAVLGVDNARWTQVGAGSCTLDRFATPKTIG